MAIETLLLLPGLEGTGTLFADLVAELPPRFKIIVARYPTDRFLSYPELIPFVQEMFPESSPFVIVAESFSTPLAVMLAAKHPANLAGLILCAGFVTSPLGLWSSLARPLVRPMLFRKAPPRLVHKYYSTGFSPPGDLEARVRAANRQVDPGVMAGRVREVLDCDARKELAGVEVPFLYIQGEGDHLVRAKCFEEIRRIRPDAKLARIAAPHLVLQREPRRSAEIICEFIDSIAVPAR
ncbi:MAG TPA: alpha/beta hydrolase [Candidatus Acidoferrales bacterium]|nr:alpha/beta hydrolase [Candidatus Acidoferrales bacterium]